MQKRLDWPMIEKTEHTLKKLFRRDHAKITSIIYRNLTRSTDKEFIYGEIDFLSFHNILEKAQPQPNDIFYDLGSGAGKAVFCAALFFDLSKSCGIELLLPLYLKAKERIDKASVLLQHSEAESRLKQIHFVNDSFLNFDFSDANIIYVAATCLHDTTWKKLINKMVKLKSGTRIIVATKSIQQKHFELIYQGIDLMSWGLCPVSIYKIRACLQ